MDKTCAGAGTVGTRCVGATPAGRHDVVARAGELTARQRVTTALEHREPDRVPIDVGATMETGIHVVAYRALRRRLGVPDDRPPRVRLRLAQLAHVEPDVQRRLGADVRGLHPGQPDGWTFAPRRADGHEEYADEFGILWRRPLPDGLYYDIAGHPLAGAATAGDVDHHPFPDPRDPGRWRGVDGELAGWRQAGAHAVVFDNSLGNGILQMGNQLMGWEGFLAALALREAPALRLMDRVLDLKLAFWDEVLTRFGPQLDVVKELDDLGTQTGPILSPAMYAEHVKPRLAELVRFIKNRAPHVRFMMHSCGGIRPMLPHLIEAGVEILNPLQYTAADMDPAELKREFGKDLTFWGGGIETQRALPSGTPQEVRDEVRRMLDILMPGGGFVFAQVHNIQPGVPVENMMAMWETAREYGVY